MTNNWKKMYDHKIIATYGGPLEYYAEWPKETVLFRHLVTYVKNY